jgi:hypothetical protein
MSGIAALTLLVRDGVAFPGELQIVTEQFESNWMILHSTDSIWLRKDIGALGWNVISATEGLMAHGMARTSGAAIATGLKQALQNVGKSFNAVEVEYIQMKNYPWFVKARVNVQAYQVEQNVVLLGPGYDAEQMMHTIANRDV